MSGDLLWGIKGSLLGYVRGMADGAVELAGGAAEAGDDFRFPAVRADAPLVFQGSVTLRGHGGMMHVTIAEPSLVETDAGWVLEIADPDEQGIRLPFCTIARFDGERGSGTALTADGADLFFGPYVEGTSIDDPRVER